MLTRAHTRHRAVTRDGFPTPAPPSGSPARPSGAARELLSSTDMLRVVLSGLVATWLLSAIRLTVARPLAARARRTPRRAA